MIQNKSKTDESLYYCKMILRKQFILSKFRKPMRNTSESSVTHNSNNVVLSFKSEMCYNTLQTVAWTSIIQGFLHDIQHPVLGNMTFHWKHRKFRLATWFPSINLIVLKVLGELSPSLRHTKHEWAKLTMCRHTVVWLSQSNKQFHRCVRRQCIEIDTVYKICKDRHLPDLVKGGN